jgi:hypothetical protein
MQRIDGLIQKIATQWHQKLPKTEVLLTITELQKALLEQLMLDNEVAATTAQHIEAPKVSQEALSVAQQSIEVAQHTQEVPKVTFPLQDIPPVAATVKINPTLVESTQASINMHTAQNSQPGMHTQKELNEILAKEDNSLNTKLNNNQQELADKLQDTPILDLRKAFSINEKFVLLQELFNNDETTFEKSIRTLNNFTTASEANIWMEREFFTLLGWNKQNPAVVDFLDTVYRRYI